MIVCVECGEIKRDTNHWMACWVSRAETYPEFHSRGLDTTDSTAEVQIVCGENCAHRVYQKFLDHLRISQ